MFTANTLFSAHIRKSGTGIRKSGTGIHKSGTGIRKSGTGGRAHVMLAAVALAACSLVSTPTFATDSPELFVSQRSGTVLISIHSNGDVIAGAASLASGESSYSVVPLFATLSLSDDGSVFTPLVKATGTGDSGESCSCNGARILVKATGTGDSGESCSGNGARTLVKATGTGDSGESCSGNGARTLVKATGTGDSGESCSGNGARTLVKATGTGDSGESCSCNGARTLVKATGTGDSGESCSGNEARTLVKATGTGDSGESTDRSSAFWGYAEIVSDPSGSYVIVYRNADSQAEEFLVAFFESHAGHDRPRDGATRNADFVMTP